MTWANHVINQLKANMLPTSDLEYKKKSNVVKEIIIKTEILSL